MLHRLCPRILADTGKNKEQADAPGKIRGIRLFYICRIMGRIRTGICTS